MIQWQAATNDIAATHAQAWCLSIPVFGANNTSHDQMISNGKTLAILRVSIVIIQNVYHDVLNLVCVNNTVRNKNIKLLCDMSFNITSEHLHKNELLLQMSKTLSVLQTRNFNKNSLHFNNKLLFQHQVIRSFHSFIRF